MKTEQLKQLGYQDKLVELENGSYVIYWKSFDGETIEEQHHNRAAVLMWPGGQYQILLSICSVSIELVHIKTIEQLEQLWLVLSGNWEPK